MIQALEGIKVADFTWAVVGPITTKCLSDHGATVVKVESIKRPDQTRLSQPFKDGIPGINRAPWFSYHNTSKYSLSLDLTHPMGVEVAKRLVAWADIVVENFSPGVMERLGLGYEDLKKIKPDIIMCRCSAQGQTGPHATQPSFGFHLIGLAGFAHMTGWPDRYPCHLAVAYTDIIAARVGVATVMAALDYRAKTGEGQCIDLSQFDISVAYFLAPVILDYTVNGREAGRMGNSCPYAAPHGVYRCQGDDRWCAIAVFTDEEWKTFCEVIGSPSWTKELKFSTLLERKKNEEELNKRVEEWTINHTAEEVMSRLQAAGVAAGLVENCADMFTDPQLAESRYFQVLDHPEIGPFSNPGQAFKLSKTPYEIKRAPVLGEHTEYVCTELLGMSDEEFIRLMTDRVFE